MDGLLAFGFRAQNRSTPLAKPDQIITAEVDPQLSRRNCNSRRSDSVKTDVYRQARKP